MKRINFLAKIRKDGKLQLVGPSDEIRKSYFGKSESNLISAKILLKNGRLEESVALAYYSMYHAASALLFRTGIKCENHAAVIIILKEVYGIDNSDISFAKKERVDKQYYVDFRVTEGEVGDLIRKAEKFNSMLIDSVSRLTNSGIAEYREKLDAISS